MDIAHNDDNRLHIQLILDRSKRISRYYHRYGVNGLSPSVKEWISIRISADDESRTISG